MKIFKKFILLTIFMFAIIFLLPQNKIYAVSSDEVTLTNTTRVYFSAEVTKTYGQSDCILLENYDGEGNKTYGLIDTGHNIAKTASDGKKSSVVVEFLKQHGVDELQFIAISHSHGDHNGDTLKVLENFKVGTIYMKEFDSKWSPDGSQDRYEGIIEEAVSKKIKVVGVSYESLISNEISPNRSTEFIEATKNADESLFEGFNENNTEIKFGSATIQIFNWEIFDENGDITTDENTTTREIVDNENNNTIGLLLTQGSKKAFFSGDMNNLDENTTKGREGDEDRIKDKIGKVDFLKLGHHGYQYSNTKDYINTLKPEYAVITNDIGNAYSETLDWLKENNVNFLYTTSDEYGVSLTMTNDEVYLGFETLSSFKNINDTIYYIPGNPEYQYADYTKIIYQLKYVDKNVEVSSWSELKKVIDDNKNDIANLDDENRICTLYRLIIKLKSGGDYTATDNINIEQQQKIIITTDDNITLLRGTSLVKSSLFTINGSLDLGQKNMTGTITLDGNSKNVAATSTLLHLDLGTLNMYNNVTLCNNLNKTIGKTLNSSTQHYTSFGSAISSTASTINMYGGSIVNNSQDVVVEHELPEKINYNYTYSVYGTGIYLTNNSVLNMYDGEISNNEAVNNSKVKTNSKYTISPKSRAIVQGCSGVGIFAGSSIVNLFGGKITNNKAVNNAETTLNTSKDSSINTYIYSLNTGIYGVGLYVQKSELTISNNFEISGNSATLNSNITLGENTYIKSTANSAIRGLQAYINNSDTKIDGLIISGGDASASNETKVTKNDKTVSAPGIKGNATSTENSYGVRVNGVSIENLGGGLDILYGTFEINNLTINNCSIQKGGGIYIQEASGSITNSNISNNEALSADDYKSSGGAIFSNLANIKISNTTLSNNKATYGGALYVTNAASNTELTNVKIEENEATGGSGGGIYAYGNLKISGDDTLISENKANTYGGGVMVKTSGIITGGVISNNSASTYGGGGIRVDGVLTMNGGTIENNTAKTYGGGVDFSNSKATFYYNLGTIQNNTASTAGNDIYPSDSIKSNLKIGDISDEFTSGDINVSIIVNDGENAIKNVSVNGKTIADKSGTYTYTVKENGTYKVTITDSAENVFSREFTITCIDKTAPTITGVSQNAIYNNDVKITAKDNLSGIKSVTLTKDGKVIDYSLGKAITESGKYVISVLDNVANETKIAFTIDKSIKDDQIEISSISSNWTNQNQNIMITLKNEIKSITVNGENIVLTNGTYTIPVENNGSYIIKIVDLDGNVITKTVDVTNIDKNSPIIYGVLDGSVYGESVKLILKDEDSGISNILVTKDGKETTYTDSEIVLYENGNYKVEVTDKAGNKATLSFSIEINEVNTDNTDNTDNTENDDSKDPDNDLVKGEENGIDEDIEGIIIDDDVLDDIDSVNVPDTGKNTILFILIGTVIIAVGIVAIKFSKSHNVKK